MKFYVSLKLAGKTLKKGTKVHIKGIGTAEKKEYLHRKEERLKKGTKIHIKRNRHCRKKRIFT